MYQARSDDDEFHSFFVLDIRHIDIYIVYRYSVGLLECGYSADNNNEMVTTIKIVSQIPKDKHQTPNTEHHRRVHICTLEYHSINTCQNS